MTYYAEQYIESERKSKLPKNAFDIMPRLKIGMKVEYFDKEFNLHEGLITDFGTCEWHIEAVNSDFRSDSICSICPGTVNIDCSGYKCRVNSPRSFINRIVSNGFLNEEDFEI